MTEKSLRNTHRREMSGKSRLCSQIKMFQWLCLQKCGVLMFYDRIYSNCTRGVQLWPISSGLQTKRVSFTPPSPPKKVYNSPWMCSLTRKKISQFGEKSASVGALHGGITAKTLKSVVKCRLHTHHHLKLTPQTYAVHL